MRSWAYFCGQEHHTGLAYKISRKPPWSVAGLVLVHIARKLVVPRVVSVSVCGPISHFRLCPAPTAAFFF